ncbi:MAG: S-layer homology domain-containing protein, partial [Bacillota bacterium]
RTLSHEYGHHFTSYWLLKHEGLLFRDWRKTEWARIRGLSNFPQVGSGYHSWEPQEIAAEDYIQLFGSPLAREALVRNVPMGDGRYIPAEIQENAAIPLAWDTPGLYEYWRKALGPAAPAPVQPIPPPTLRFVSASPTRWNTTEVTLEWAPGHGMPPGGQFYLWQDNVPAPEQIRLDWKYPGYLVQPLTYDGPGLERITVQAQPIVAPDGGLMTRYRFYVVAVHNGQIVSSNKVVLEGVNTPSPRLVTEEPPKVPPAITPGARLWDIRNHWAEAQIRALVDQGVVNGYPDGSFKPEQPITRAEFLKLLASALGYQPQEGTPPDFAGLAKHWLATGGWLAPLAEAGTIQPGELLTAADLDVRLSRQEMARYLVRALGQPPSSEPVAMSDAFQIGSAFRGYVSAAVQLGLLQGIPDGAGGVAFRPLDSTTRAQAAVVLSRLLDRVRR